MKRKTVFKFRDSQMAVLLVGIFMLLLFSGCSLIPDRDDPPPPIKMTAKEVIKKAGPSVVNIKTSTGSGTGVIYSEDGYIITNDHVISDADGNSYEIQMADSRSIKAKLIGTDSRSDLAVLKIEAKNLQAAKFADSSKVEKGDDVVAIGNAKGVQDSTTQGIISNVNVEANDGTNIKKVLQTDAAINPGNSGGALVNMYAEVIGINEMSRANTDNMSYAIPSNEVKKIADQLIKQGYVSWPYLGVEADQYRNIVYVKSVQSGSPAAKAGVRQGDIILKVNNTEISNVAQLREQLNNSGIGSVVSIDTVRINKNGKITSSASREVKLEELPKGHHKADWS